MILYIITQLKKIKSLELKASTCISLAIGQNLKFIYTGNVINA